ncbi:hypothetical protein GCM10028794_04220 [Silanimonas algicola]
MKSIQSGFGCPIRWSNWGGAPDGVVVAAPLMRPSPYGVDGRRRTAAGAATVYLL